MTGYEVIALYSVLFGVPIVSIYIALRGITRKGRLSKKNVYQFLLEGCLIQYLITLFAVTLWPIAGFRRARILNLVPLVELFNALTGKILLNPTYVLKVWCYNVCMFIPFGILGVLYLHVIEKKHENIFCMGLILILGIESMQYFFVNGRAADINDVITNMLGIALGYFVGKLFVKKINIFDA